MKSQEDVLQESGISYYTLFKYTSLGLVPHSQRVWRGRKGSESWYPDDTVNTIKRIKEEQKSGLTLREIAENWKIERALKAFTAVMNDFPDYRFVSGVATESHENPDGSIIVKVELRGVKRR